MKNYKLKIIHAINLSLDLSSFRETKSFKKIAVGDFVFTNYFKKPSEKHVVKNIFINRKDNNKAMLLVFSNLDTYLIPHSSLIKSERLT